MPAASCHSRFALLVSLAALCCSAVAQTQGPPRLLAWNDLGMHCMDGDMSVFSILPPFNTFHAQLIVNGQLVANPNFSITYQAIADPSGSINTSSIGKTDFWQHSQALFGVTLPLNEGLAGFRMPGAANTPQSMAFHSGISHWKAEGVPITPYDDAGAMQPYPLMRLVAKSPQGQVLAMTDTVLPVSAEMACVTCHGSGGSPAARPPSGWVYGSPATDDRLNILKLHDERHLGESLYDGALAAVGYSSSGLLATAVQNQTSVLCARCHGSVALNALGQPGVSTMTTAMHNMHGLARLPDGRMLNDVNDRSSCYTCHPGAATRCLRGAMGKAIGQDGNAMMSCQDCHGGMSEVADPNRTGWLDEPTCQACHTGDAVQNEGQIRFDHAFDSVGQLRVPVNQRFATQPDAPQAPYSLYRFSTGHGGLECSACHGSTHAIWPSSERNDNLQSVAVQGHIGTINECIACHDSLEDNELEGPHGMHPTGAFWVDKHSDVADQNGVASCRTCHGTDYRGTELSRSHADRTLTSQFGTVNFWRGYEVGCYECHNGPLGEHTNSNSPPVVQSRNESVPSDLPLTLTLTATDTNNDPTTLRIVSQPKHGAVAFDGSQAVYRAWDDYVGTDSFTYAAADGESNSNLGVVTIAVGARDCLGTSAVYGYGCSEQSGVAPTLALSGCATGGQQVQLEVAQLPTTTFAVLALGVGRGGVELGPDGCTLRLSQIAATSDVIAVTSGGFALPVAIPTGLGTWTGNFQVFALAPSEPRAFVATHGLEVEFH